MAVCKGVDRTHKKTYTGNPNFFKSFPFIIIAIKYIYHTYACPSCICIWNRIFEKTKKKEQKFRFTAIRSTQKIVANKKKVSVKMRNSLNK